MQGWGQERFVRAAGALSSWYIEHGMPKTVEATLALAKADVDAFRIFAARAWEASESIMQGGE